MEDITTAEWAEQAILLLPKTLHPAVHEFTDALGWCDNSEGQPYLDEGDIVPFIHTDSALAGIGRMVDLGWIVYAEGRFSTGSTTSPISGGGTPRGQETRHRTPISTKRRNAVFVRDGRTCWLCGLRATVATMAGVCTDWDAVVDHVVPHSMGGSNGPENLRTAHSWCNVVRGARPAPIRAIQWARVVKRHATQFADYMCGYSNIEPPSISPSTARKAA